MTILRVGEEYTINTDKLIYARKFGSGSKIVVACENSSGYLEINVATPYDLLDGILRGFSSWINVERAIEDRKAEAEAARQPQDTIYAVERIEPIKTYPQDFIADNPATRLG